jgi:hypothetical protein
VWGAFFWIASPYLFFYERLGQSDAEAGAFVVIAVWGAFRLAKHGAPYLAILTGFMLATATLMKFTAAPFAIVIFGIVMLYGHIPPLQRLRNLIIIGFTGILMFSVPIGYLMLRGGSMFRVALEWIGNEGDAGRSGWRYNLSMFTTQLTDFSFAGIGWLILGIVGLGWVCWFGKFRAIRIVVLSFIPLILVVRLSSTTFPRHFIVMTPLLLILAGAGWGILVTQISSLPIKRGIYTIFFIFVATNSGSFMLTAYNSPSNIKASELVMREFVEEHSSGFGLKAAMLELPLHVPLNTEVIASMFPASCRRANFYATGGYQLICVDAPAEAEIVSSLNERGEVYVLIERSAYIGIEVTDVEATPELLGYYPRPGNISFVALYRFYRD